jgi:hypothetical protein
VCVLLKLLMSVTSAGLLIVIAGCGGNDGAGAEKAATVPFTGKVTLDGQPYGSVSLQFLPESGEGGARTSYAVVTEDGSFEATTYVTGDGIVPGKYIIKVGSDDDMASTDPAAMMGAVSGTAIANMEVDVPAEGLEGVELKMKRAETGGGNRSAGTMLGM